EPEPHGVCPVDGLEAADWERSDRKHRAARRQSVLERAEPLLVPSQCRGSPAPALLLQGGSVEHVETYDDFAPGSAGNLTGKMGTRPRVRGANHRHASTREPTRHACVTTAVVASPVTMRANGYKAPMF